MRPIKTMSIPNKPTIGILRISKVAAIPSTQTGHPSIKANFLLVMLHSSSISVDYLVPLKAKSHLQVFAELNNFL